MQHGEGRKPGYAIARYDTLERRNFPFRASSALKHLMIQEVNWRRDKLIALIQITLRLATFVIPKREKEKKKKKDRETIDSVILKSNIFKKPTSSYLTYYLDQWYHKAGCTHLATVNSAFDICVYTKICKIPVPWRNARLHTLHGNNSTNVSAAASEEVMMLVWQCLNLVRQTPTSWAVCHTCGNTVGKRCRQLLTYSI